MAPRYKVWHPYPLGNLLGWPGKEATMQELKQLYDAEIAAVHMLGSDQPLAWSLTDQELVVNTPDERPFLQKLFSRLHS